MNKSINFEIQNLRLEVNVRMSKKKLRKEKVSEELSLDEGNCLLIKQNKRNMGYVTVFSDVPDEVEKFQVGGQFEDC